MPLLLMVLSSVDLLLVFEVILLVGVAVLVVGPMAGAVCVEAVAVSLHHVEQVHVFGKVHLCQ